MLHILFHMFALLGAVAAGGIAFGVVWLSITTQANKIARALLMETTAPPFPDPAPVRMQAPRRPRPALARPVLVRAGAWRAAA